MEIVWEDILKYGTRDEIEFLREDVSSTIGRELLAAIRQDRISLLKILGLPEESFGKGKLSDMDLYRLLTKTDYEKAVIGWYNRKKDPTKKEMEPSPFGGR